MFVYTLLYIQVVDLYCYSGQRGDELVGTRSIRQFNYVENVLFNVFQDFTVEGKLKTMLLSSSNFFSFNILNYFQDK